MYVDHDAPSALAKHLTMRAAQGRPSATLRGVLPTARGQCENCRRDAPPRKHSAAQCACGCEPGAPSAEDHQQTNASARGSSPSRVHSQR